MRMMTRRICGTCKHQDCGLYSEDRYDWVCLNYEEADAWQMTLNLEGGDHNDDD